MAMTVEDFKNECAPHIEALRDLTEKMASHGLKSEDCQRLSLLNDLTELERGIDSIEPFDLIDVDMDNDDLFLKDSAADAFNNDPSLRIFEVEVWFDDGEDSTTVVEEYKCLIAAESEKKVEAMGEQIHQMLNVDEALFVNIGCVDEIRSSLRDC